MRPRLRTILILVNVVILSLPLGGIAVLRIYESALVRQTESELIAQGAFVAAAYRAALHRISAEYGAPNGGLLGSGQLSHYGRALAPPWRQLATSTEPWRPRLATLDLATDRPLPPGPNPRPSALRADPLALLVGRSLTPVLRDAQAVTLAGIRVVDFRGIIVASTGDDLVMDMGNSIEVSRALRGEPLSLLRLRVLDQPPPPLDSISRGSRIRAIVATPIVLGDRVLGAVILARTPSNIFKALYGKRYLLVQMGFALLAVVLLLALFTSLTITRPVQALIRQAERALRGEKGAVTPLARPVTQEIARLSSTVAALAATLENRADYIRNFAAHVSHEFKTPLTAIRGAVELLSDHADTMSAAERERFLNNLQLDTERLERLLARLLELACAEVMTPVGGTENGIASNAVAIIEQACARYRQLGLTIHLELAIPTPCPPIAIPAEVFDAVLCNLLENARQHAGEQAAVAISLARAGRSGRDGLRLRVADSGSGVSTANAARIFEPFFTTARKRGGTGLGLAIVKALLQAHGSDIELLASGQRARAGTLALGGAQFEIRLPLSQA